MTSGRGIAHAEESPQIHDPTLHGVQLWVALPDASRHVEPAFEHYGQLSQTSIGGFAISVLIGDLAGASSPASAFSPIVGAQLSAAAGSASCLLPLRADYEHAVFVATGQADVEGALLQPGQLLYLPTGRDQMALAAPAGATLILLGGEPLREQLLMWWNFVARTPEEIDAAAAAWRAGDFGPVGGYQGAPMQAPPLDMIRLRRPR
jgi:redox-sensitive bicupin YhaK (pirin superfamily)